MILTFSLLTTFLYTSLGYNNNNINNNINNNNNIPGRVITWTTSSLSPSTSSSHSTSSSSSSSPIYKTQTILINDLFHNELINQLNNKEILITFCSNDKQSNNFYTNDIFKNEILNSGDSIIHPNIYQSIDKIENNICSNLIQFNELKDTKIVTPNEMIDLLSNSDILSNNKLESYMIEMSSNTEIEQTLYKDLFSKVNTPNALFLALQNPSNTPPTVAGQYHRLLTSDIEDGVNYLPEGTEFSIYYQAQYLYLTPDIFTGIMTGIFMAIVLIIGFNCMGAIQGPSSYPSVLPPLGKEG